MVWQEIENKWKFGEPDLGGDVYEDTNGWSGELVIYNTNYKLLPKPNLKEAMANAQNRFVKFYEQYHEENN